MKFGRCKRELGIATLYVTHDQAEAMVLSDRIIVMNEGHLEQVGTPWEIYEHPKSEFVSDFIGMANLLEAVVAGELAGERSLMKLLGNDRELTINRRISGKDPALLLIRPENIQLGRLQDLPAENTWSSKVELAAYSGDHRQYVVRDGAVTIRAKTGPKPSLIEEMLLAPIFQRTMLLLWKNKESKYLDRSYQWMQNCNWAHR